MVKIGDKVRFLNSVGGGIVVKQVNKDIILVEEDDGFETPVLMRECVVIEPARPEPAPENFRTPSAKPVVPADTTPEETLEIIETPEGEKLNIWLAYVPEDRQHLQDSRYDAYLVNDSNYFLYYTYLNRTEAGWHTRQAGIIEPNIKLHLEEFGKENLNELETVCLQYLPFKQDKPFSLKNPAAVEIRLDTVKFYKLHSFRENDYFDEEALLYPIVRNDLPERQISLSAAELEAFIREKKTTARKPERQPLAKKKSGTPDIIETDLHIHELLDTTAGLSNADILNYQLEKFREVMDTYKNKKGQKLVFIHGKGDGVLRNAIIKELRSQYKNAYYQDASFREYGFGATMVTIR